MTVNKTLVSKMTLENSGFVLMDQLISLDRALALISVLAKLKLKPGQGGIRSIETLVTEVGQLANSPAIMAVVRQYLPGQPKLVRAIYFTKSEQNNWYVTWHQDKTVAVSQRFNMEGWIPWSLKAGVWHVQPPVTVLEQMLTLRIHLDAATRTNGCLKVIHGSHQAGLMTNAEITETVAVSQPVYCEVPAGGAVIMKPHILHASEKTTSSNFRRVLHFEYSNYQLPNGIKWSA